MSFYDEESNEFCLLILFAVHAQFTLSVRQRC